MQTDPVQRLLLMTTYEALEMAGYRYDTKSDRSRIGTFIGVATDDWREYNISQDVDLVSLPVACVPLLRVDSTTFSSLKGLHMLSTRHVPLVVLLWSWPVPRF
jgi:acyl transferase domain-containing protein